MNKNREKAELLQQTFHGLEYSWGDELPNEISEVDLIIASDVVYSPECYRPLYESISLLLKKNTNSRCILAHRHRHPEDAKFFSMIESDSELEIVELDWMRDCGEIGLKKMDIRLFSIHAK
jgi:hypothetical protein